MTKQSQGAGFLSGLRDGVWRSGIAAALGVALAGAVALPTLTVVSAPATQNAEGSFFNLTNVHHVHLRLTPEQWTAMEPAGGDGPFGGRPGGGPGGPGRQGGPGGRGGGFGPGMFVGPAMFSQADQDKSGKLSKAEFTGLAEKWFSDWDKDKAGKLNEDKVREGLNASLMGPPGGPGGGPGGAGRPGGGPRMGLNLQGAEGRRNGLSSAAGIEFKYVHADLELNGQTLKDVAVRYKGNGTFMQSRGSDKRSMKVDLNKFTKGQTVAGIATLNLHNSVTDASWMNEVLSHRLFADAGVPAPRSAYARVYVTVPGKFEKKFLGLYSVVENPDSRFLARNFPGNKGVLLKPVTPRPFEDLGDDWAKYNQTYDPKSDLTAAQKQRVIEFCKLVSHADDAQFAAKLGDYLDLDNFSRFMAVTTWLATMDSILGPGQNYYVRMDGKTQKLQFMPWDLDHSFGQFGMMGSQEQREQLSIKKPWQGENRFLERVYKTESFQKLYRARMEEFSKSIFQPERFVKQVDLIAASIRPAVQEESEEKLARFDKVVAGQSVSPAGFGGPPGGGPGRGPGGESGRPPGGPGGGNVARFGPPGGFEGPKPIKGFVKPRHESVLAQLTGKSQGEEVGFGGPGGPGGRGGRGPGNFGPGNFLAAPFVAAADSNKNGEVTKAELSAAFGKWFDSWDKAKTGALSEDDLRAGLNEEFSPFRGGGPGGPGGPPPQR